MSHGSSMIFVVAQSFADQVRTMPGGEHLPCLGCATHVMPRQMPLLVKVYNHSRELAQEIRRD
jgi:hypothetical protein